MTYPNPEDLMTGPMRDFVDAASFGQTLTVYTDTYAGRHPDEGTPDWDEDTTGTEVSGRIEERQQLEEQQRTTGRAVEGEFYIYVPNDEPVQDGHGDEEADASRVVDEDGNEYEITLVTDQHNGLYRCTGAIL